MDFADTIRFCRRMARFGCHSERRDYAIHLARYQRTKRTA
jgi:hypothetical protein